MHITLTNILKSWFKGGYGDKKVPKQLLDEDHTYIKGDIETRGPCPGLNALANQGWLPRDGKNIKLSQVQHALMAALHMDWLAAASLVSSLLPLLRPDGTFDLIDTRRHNVIEHDASFTRLDFCQGDNYTFQPSMLADVLADADGGPVTHQSMAKTFVRRSKESRAAGAPRLGIRLWFVRLLQYVGAINTAQTGGVLSRENMEAIFRDEYFPEVVTQNQKTRTVFTLLGNALAMMRYVIFP